MELTTILIAVHSFLLGSALCAAIITWYYNSILDQLSREMKQVVSSLQRSSSLLKEEQTSEYKSSKGKRRGKKPKEQTQVSKG